MQNIHLQQSNPLLLNHCFYLIRGLTASSTTTNGITQ